MSALQSHRQCLWMCCFCTSMLGAWGAWCEASFVGWVFRSADGISYLAELQIEDSEQALRGPLWPWPCCLLWKVPSTFPLVVYLEFHLGSLREMRLSLRGMASVQQREESQALLYTKMRTQWEDREDLSPQTDRISQKHTSSIRPGCPMHRHQVKAILCTSLTSFSGISWNWWPWPEGPSLG